MAIISDTVIKAYQYRIQQEEQSSRIYNAMYVWLSLNGYPGAAKLWKKYSEEELVHAGYAYDYLLSLNILPITPSQEQPQNEFKGLPQIIAITRKHEIDVTNQCNDLARTCLNEGDVMSFGVAQRYVAEQIEELDKTQYLIDRLQAFGDDKIALRLLDNELAELAEK